MYAVMSYALFASIFPIFNELLMDRLVAVPRFDMLMAGGWR
jgi:hypothetical protein